MSLRLTPARMELVADHTPEFRSRRTGVGNQYGRGGSGSGGRNTHVFCSCGWSSTTNQSKAESERDFKDHLRALLTVGMWRVERDRYDEVLTSYPAGYARAEYHEAITALGVGDCMEAEGERWARQGTMIITRVAAPLEP